MKAKRRDFIRSTTLGGVILPMVGNAAPSDDVLRGFIVSDAHFGWSGSDQPVPAEQAAAMEKIVREFPDLDVMIDTGDAHHGGLRGAKGDAARGGWTDIIAGITGSVPFMYVPGNHEIMGWNEGDPEWRCNRLGSLCCRPYYSFDLKGIHFVSVPELMMAVYVNRETIEWLKLDLALNRDKTVVLLSHNNISGTTGPDEPGYRGLVNSSELMGIIRANPNVVAWMHGHNHNFQMVKMENRVFVSNGRIGGFDPSKGKFGIGGIYFEIGRKGLKVRSYDASRGRMLKPKDGLELETDLSVATSYDSNGTFNYSYGAGGARDTERIPVINHYAGTSPADELFIGGADGSMISEDPRMTLYQNRPSNNHMQLFGFIVRDPKKRWQWDNPGITLHKRDDNKDIRVTLPHYGAGQGTYYRCPPGKKYKVTLDLEAEATGPVLDMQFLWFDRTGEFLTQWNLPKYPMKQGRQTKVFTTDAPNPGKVKTIYDDPAEDNILNLISQAIFRKMTAAVKIHSFKLEFADADETTLNPSIDIDGKVFEKSAALANGALAAFKVPPFVNDRQVVGTGAQGNGRLAWLVRRSNLDWQVRNAPVADKGNHLEIGSLRNPWTFQKEIRIAPLFQCLEMFVSRLAKVDGAKIFPLNRGNKNLRIEIGKTLGDGAMVEITAPRKPRKVTGSKDWKYTDGVVEVWVESGGIIEIA